MCLHLVGRKSFVRILVWAGRGLRTVMRTNEGKGGDGNRMSKGNGKSVGAARGESRDSGKKKKGRFLITDRNKNLAVMTVACEAERCRFFDEWSINS